MTDTPTFAQQMVTKYQGLLLQAAGVQSISVDGQSMTVADLKAQWQFWSKQVAIENGTKPRLSVIKMGACNALANCCGESRSVRGAVDGPSIPGPI